LKLVAFLNIKRIINNLRQLLQDYLQNLNNLFQYANQNTITGEQYLLGQLDSVVQILVEFQVDEVLDQVLTEDEEVLED
jgi:hypothetical protein